MHLRENKIYDIIKVWWERMQDKWVVHDFEKIQTNIKEWERKECLSLALTFIDIKI